MSKNYEADIINLKSSINKLRGQTDLEQGITTHAEFHPEPIRPGDEEDRTPVNLVDHSRDDLLTKFAISISDTVKFPRSTVFLHGIGCIAAAMNKSFSIEHHGSEMPVCLYIVSAQPPSTGKSGVNKYLSMPINTSYQDLNDKNKIVIAQTNAKIKDLLKLLKKASNEQEELDLIIDLDNKNKILDEHPIYKGIVTNATPEAMEQQAFKQKGIFNIISDESGSINSVLGMSYGDSSKPTNSDLVLQGWDGGYFSSLRVTRDASSGYVRGSISVLAQYETVHAILQQAIRGNGVPERFLLCAEPHMLGTRNHLKHTPINTKLNIAYKRLIHNLIMSDDVVLKLDSEAHQFIMERQNENELEMGDLGRYSTNMLRGFVGKMDKQVLKIACVLHAVIEFKDAIGSVYIKKSTVVWAYEIFKEITKLYIEAVDNQGYSGEKSQISSCYEYMLKMAEKSTYRFKVQRMIDGIKKQHCWAEQSKQTTHFRKNIMPKLTAMNICSYDADSNYIWINPKL